jgi:hypothetical protein
MFPKCNSQFLMIRPLTALERLQVALTGKRKYICQQCLTEFRAKDRQMVSREIPAAESLRYPAR